MNNADIEQLLLEKVLKPYSKGLITETRNILKEITEDIPEEKVNDFLNHYDKYIRSLFGLYLLELRDMAEHFLTND